MRKINALSGLRFFDIASHALRCIAKNLTTCGYSAIHRNFLWLLRIVNFDGKTASEEASHQAELNSAELFPRQNLHR